MPLAKIIITPNPSFSARNAIMPKEERLTVCPFLLLFIISRLNLLNIIDFHSHDFGRQYQDRSKKDRCLCCGESYQHMPCRKMGCSWGSICCESIRTVVPWTPVYGVREGLNYWWTNYNQEGMVSTVMYEIVSSSWERSSLVSRKFRNRGWGGSPQNSTI